MNLERKMVTSNDEVAKIAIAAFQGVDHDEYQIIMAALRFRGKEIKEILVPDIVEVTMKKTIMEFQERGVISQDFTW